MSFKRLTRSSKKLPVVREQAEEQGSGSKFNFFVTSPTKSVQGALVFGPTTNQNLVFVAVAKFKNSLNSKFKISQSQIILIIMIHLDNLVLNL